ncbi:MAG: hypothetical protein M3Y87_25380 [Myxococcota bacterium]|nr:hypothetical protein [Myxococcota bacterium]
MPDVELAWDLECPNVRQARESLWAAFAAHGTPAAWTEWDLADTAAPAHVRGHGSPSIFVGAREITGAGPGAHATCRVYRGGDGALRGAPAVEVIARALAEAAPGGGQALHSKAIEVFTAGGACCDDALALVHRVATSGSRVEVRDMHDPAVAARARDLGIARVPSLVVDGRRFRMRPSGGFHRGD